MLRTLAIAAICLAAGCPKSAKTVRIAAASDLQRAFEEIGAKFEAETGIKAEFDFGSSGLLAKQIEQGAPYSLFAAANKEYVEQVVAAGRCDAATAQLYSRGRIVVWTPNGVEPPKQLADLADPRFKKIAIANPAHAPYGRAAQQALEKVDVWSKVQDRLVLGENVQAAMMYARSNNVDVAIVALSLAVVIDTEGKSLAVPPELYDPLDQQLVVCGGGPGADAARKLAEMIQSPAGREIMKRYGFLLPQESMRGAAR